MSSRVSVNVDGGARGNPGPAAIGAIVTGPDGEILAREGRAIGKATNNVAEYRAMLLGIDLAKGVGADKVELIGDSELIVKQIRGEYKVKDATLRELHSEVAEALSPFASWAVRHVRREDNHEADRLVNVALDGDEAQ